jgi:hypothetical protein
MSESKTASWESRTAADGLVDRAEDCEALWDYCNKLEDIIDALRYGREIPHRHLYRGRLGRD